jgi:hypothetical protein
MRSRRARAYASTVTVSFFIKARASVAVKAYILAGGACIADCWKGMDPPLRRSRLLSICVNMFAREETKGREMRKLSRRGGCSGLQSDATALKMDAAACWRSKLQQAAVTLCSVWWRRGQA